MTTSQPASSPRDIASLLAFLAKLERGHLHYDLAFHRPNSLMVLVTVPGERWEVEFMLDGSIEIEIFRSDGSILDMAALSDLWKFMDD
jgi:hypothetical protein